MSNKRKLNRSSRENLNRLAKRVETRVRQHIDQGTPGLPPLSWGTDVEADGTFWVEGVVMDPINIDREYSDAEVWDIVTRYAKAIGGNEPRIVVDERGCRELETTAVIRGVNVLIFGPLSRPER